MGRSVLRLLLQQQPKLLLGLVGAALLEQRLRQLEPDHIRLVSAQISGADQQCQGQRVGRVRLQQCERVEIGPYWLARFEAFGLGETAVGLGAKVMGRQDDAQAAPRRTGFRLRARDSAASRWPLPLLAQRRRAGWRGRDRAWDGWNSRNAPTPARAAATTPARRNKSRRPRRLLSFVKPLLSVVVAMSVLYRR